MAAWLIVLNFRYISGTAHPMTWVAVPFLLAAKSDFRPVENEFPEGGRFSPENGSAETVPIIRVHLKMIDKQS